jgi:hypothetical protein
MSGASSFSWLRLSSFEFMRLGDDVEKPYPFSTVLSFGYVGFNMVLRLYVRCRDMFLVLLVICLTEILFGLLVTFSIHTEQDPRTWREEILYLYLSIPFIESLTTPSTRTQSSYVLPLQLPHLDLNPLLHFRLQLLIQPHLEQDLVPHKQRRQKQRLHQIIQQRRLPPLKLAVPNKLRNPTDHVHRNRYRIHARPVVPREHLVCERGGTEEQRCGADACEVGREQQVQGGVGECSEGAEVEGEVEACEERGGAERECGCVCALATQVTSVICVVTMWRGVEGDARIRSRLREAWGHMQCGSRRLWGRGGTRRTMGSSALGFLVIELSRCVRRRGSS